MKGFQVSFYTVESRTHQGKQVGHWLIDLARALQIDGATLSMGIEGIGRGGTLHSAHFMEVADQPVTVTMVVSEGESERLFATLVRERVDIFYVKTPAEYGLVGAS